MKILTLPPQAQILCLAKSWGVDPQNQEKINLKLSVKVKNHES